MVPATCLALGSMDPILHLLVVHQLGLLVRQLVQNMQVLRANRLSKAAVIAPAC
jgi:hypothetical protein